MVSLFEIGFEERIWRNSDQQMTLSWLRSKWQKTRSRLNVSGKLLLLLKNFLSSDFVIPYSGEDAIRLKAE